MAGFSSHWAAAIELIGLQEVVGLQPPNAWQRGFWTPEQGTDPYGPFVNKHHFAGWMVMALSLAMGVVLAGIARGMRDVNPDWRHRLRWLSSRNASLLVLTCSPVWSWDCRWS